MSENQAARAVQVARDNYVAVRQAISDRATSELSKLLPPEKAARFVATALRALARNPELLQATQKSLVNAFYDAAVLDLEPVLGAVYFVKYGTEATMQIGYKGLVDLAKRGDPTLEDIYGQCVYEGDEFDYTEGTDPFILHKPSLTRTISDPTKITHVYAVALRTGGRRPVFTVLTKADVDNIRARSKARNAGPWVTDYPAMGQKTAVRQLCVRRLSLSTVIKEAIERDDEREFSFATPTDPVARTASLKDALRARATPPPENGTEPEIEGEAVEVAPGVTAEPPEKSTDPVAEASPAPQTTTARPADVSCPLSPYDPPAPCILSPGHRGFHRGKEKETW